MRSSFITTVIAAAMGHKYSPGISSGKKLNSKKVQSEADKERKILAAEAKRQRRKAKRLDQQKKVSSSN